MKGTRYHQAEKQYMKDNYLIRPVKTIAHDLGRSEFGVRNQIRILGLVIPAEIIKMNIENSRFKKGHKPFNAGVKQSEWLSPDKIEVVRKTQFKKGQEPHNTNYDGHERISKDGYVEVRVSKGVYRLKSRVVWEQTHGRKVPKSHIIAFRDGDKLNLDPDNLVLMSRVENMERNTIQRFPRELKQVIKLSHKLKRKLNEKLNK